MITNDEIEKLVESEMGLYREVLSDQGLEEKIQEFEKIHRSTYSLISSYLLDQKYTEILLSDLFVHGVIARTQNLTRGVLLGIRDSNRYLVPQCQRALLETCALVNYVYRNPDYLSPALLDDLILKTQ